jgi:signal transduction histidine kinase
MFFYNLRAIFLIGGAWFLVILYFDSLLSPSSSAVSTSIVVLTVFWFLDVTLTLLLHPSFVRQLKQWGDMLSDDEFPPIFVRYFILDSIVVMLIILAGRWYKLHLDLFATLLVANMIIYSVYVPGLQRFKQLLIIAAVLPLAIASVLFFKNETAIEPPFNFNLILYLGPLIGVLIITILTTLVIPWLRKLEHESTLKRLERLGKYAGLLSEPLHNLDRSQASRQDQVLERSFSQQAQKVLKDICSLGLPFWYESACLWLLEYHQDLGDVYIPAAFWNFPEAREFPHGLAGPTEFSDCEAVTLIHSLRTYWKEGLLPVCKFRPELDAPVAFVPLHFNKKKSDTKKRGILALYGKNGGSPLQRQDRTFLDSLSFILSTAIDQWESRYSALPQRAMDELFKCKDLPQVFQRTAALMKKYLFAEGCMVIFRREPSAPEMEIVATSGLQHIFPKEYYDTGVGNTGECAKNGLPIRFDDVQINRKRFNSTLIRELETALGRRLVSWMAIPIGNGERNHGVIKVVNRDAPCNWFRKSDEILGVALATRLQVLIQKFLSVEKMEAHMDEANTQRDEAKKQSQKALAEQQRAEANANQRQEDITVITHQLQGPLASMMGTVSLLKETGSRTELEGALRDLEDIIEDAIAVCYGTFTAFALREGKPTDFLTVRVDAPTELVLLCERLQRTNSRQDLRFVPRLEEGFPPLLLDKHLFTSVFYGLIHNAMKYADDDSDVILEASLERTTGMVALKVKSTGEPIHPSETERIFEKFKRGRDLEKTGRKYVGVGLGLWIARELMKAVGGNLTVEISRNNPRFSVFIVHFPRSQS